jgi:hypothetical protein
MNVGKKATSDVGVDQLRKKGCEKEKWFDWKTWAKKCERVRVIKKRLWTRGGRLEAGGEWAERANDSFWMCWSWAVNETRRTTATMRQKPKQMKKRVKHNEQQPTRGSRCSSISIGSCRGLRCRIRDGGCEGWMWMRTERKELEWTRVTGSAPR